MKELSLHILDIAENSITAKAKNIILDILECSKTDLLQITIKDDGVGMDAESVDRLMDPFFTSRTTRRVGLGIPLLKAAAEACNGSMEINSTPGKGTEVKVNFQRNHIDRMPIGDLSSTFLTLLIGSPEINWFFCYTVDKRRFEINSQEISSILGDVPFSDPHVMKWLRSFIEENILAVQTK